MKRGFAAFILVTGAALVFPSYAAAQLPGMQTPGAKAGVSEAEICSGDFEASVKPLSPWQVGQALSRYGKRMDDKSFVVDHLIPVSLGGTNDPDNLWPQPIQKELGPDAKDELEARLKTMVCNKSMTLKAAQDAIKKDWVKAYRQYVVNAN